MKYDGDQESSSYKMGIITIIHMTSEVFWNRTVAFWGHF